MEMHVIECYPDINGEEVLLLGVLASDTCVTLGRSLKFPGPASTYFRNLLRIQPEAMWKPLNTMPDM